MTPLQQDLWTTVEEAGGMAGEPKSEHTLDWYKTNADSFRERFTSTFLGELHMSIYQATAYADEIFLVEYRVADKTCLWEFDEFILAMEFLTGTVETHEAVYHWPEVAFAEKDAA